MAKKRTVNKSQKIRDYLAKHPEAGPTAVAQRFNVSVSLVSSIKAKSKPGRRTKRTARGALRRRGRADPGLRWR